MTIGTLVNLMRGGIEQVFIIILPILSAAVVIGLIVAIFQATTSIQEQTLTFVPKVLAIFVTLMLASHWMMNNMSQFMVNLWSDFTRYIH